MATSSILSLFKDFFICQNSSLYFLSACQIIPNTENKLTNKFQFSFLALIKIHPNIEILSGFLLVDKRLKLILSC